MSDFSQQPQPQPQDEQLVLRGQFKIDQPWKRGLPTMSVATLTSHNIIRFHEGDEQGNILNQTPYAQFSVSEISKCGMTAQTLELWLHGDAKVTWSLNPAVHKGDMLKTTGATMLGQMADTGFLGKLFMGRSNKVSHKVAGATGTPLNVAIEWREKLEELGVKAQFLE
ncbi:MAG: hypothetical protein LBK95_09175 [Bifidobacteriaceae bacterium]|nr:hypothetical protein [Bifidobacteriaceae bacterium]